MPISSYLKELREEVGTRLLLLPGVSAVVIDAHGRVLLAQSADDRRWALIAGVMEPGEQPAEAIVREVYEETAVHVVVERVTSVFTQPVHTYANGDRCEYVDIGFRCRVVGGEARVNDDESLAVGWFELSDLPPLEQLSRHRIECAFRPGDAAWFGTPGGAQAGSIASE